jgi:hypothetical protein
VGGGEIRLRQASGTGSNDMLAEHKKNKFVVIE